MSVISSAPFIRETPLCRTFICSFNFFISSLSLDTSSGCSRAIIDSAYTARSRLMSGYSLGGAIGAGGGIGLAGTCGHG
ncbi:hypothetical protein LguiB_017831 [Lonicera macranthoides]